MKIVVKSVDKLHLLEDHWTWAGVLVLRFDYSWLDRLRCKITGEQPETYDFSVRFESSKLPKDIIARIFAERGGYHDESKP